MYRCTWVEIMVSTCNEGLSMEIAITMKILFQLRSILFSKVRIYLYIKCIYIKNVYICIIYLIYIYQMDSNPFDSSAMVYIYVKYVVGNAQYEQIAIQTITGNSSYN